MVSEAPRDQEETRYLRTPNKELQSAEVGILTPEAQDVLRHMKKGCPLIGSILRRGAPFDLELRNGSEEVNFATVAELVENGFIVPVIARDPDNAEYRPRNRSLLR